MGYVQRIDASRNMARHYTMSIEPDLFRGSALVCRWCRIGTRGQERIHLSANNGQAISRFLFLTRRKRAHGYKPLSYS
ncbi:WGR domain-containing protein [Sinorhizobium sp. BJ1]|uniref:WGR domain-containing protein n=1 Tax=Sinorhizobium sp. BJ1 TaxID=2035455 RepID=UPI0024780FD7|nr:WGR domain-containing protein [Sinorhizobium sp. BJ1]